jgi:hypothetical protein
MNVRLSMNPPETKWLDVVPVTQLYPYVHIFQADKAPPAPPVLTTAVWLL